MPLAPSAGPGANKTNGLDAGEAMSDDDGASLDSVSVVDDARSLATSVQTGNRSRVSHEEPADSGHGLSSDRYEGDLPPATFGSDLPPDFYEADLPPDPYDGEPPPDPYDGEPAPGHDEGPMSGDAAKPFQVQGRVVSREGNRKQERVTSRGSGRTASDGTPKLSRSKSRDRDRSSRSKPRRDKSRISIPRSDGIERRMDPNDGTGPWTKQEFLDEYGVADGTVVWDAAAPPKPPPGPTRSSKSAPKSSKLVMTMSNEKLLAAVVKEVGLTWDEARKKTTNELRAVLKERRDALGGGEAEDAEPAEPKPRSAEHEALAQKAAERVEELFSARPSPATEDCPSEKAAPVVETTTGEPRVGTQEWLQWRRERRLQRLAQEQLRAEAEAAARAEAEKQGEAQAKEAAAARGIKDETDSTSTVPSTRIKARSCLRKEVDCGPEVFETMDTIDVEIIDIEQEALRGGCGGWIRSCGIGNTGPVRSCVDDLVWMRSCGSDTCVQRGGVVKIEPRRSRRETKGASGDGSPFSGDTWI